MLSIRQGRGQRSQERGDFGVTIQVDFEFAGEVSEPDFDWFADVSDLEVEGARGLAAGPGGARLLESP